MKLNVSVIADIHLGKKDDKRLWKELQEIFIPTINDDLDLLVIAGDLFDRVIKLNEVASNYAFKFIDQLVMLSKIHNFKIRIVKGTKGHDYNQLNNFQAYEVDDNFGIANEVCEEELFEGVNVLYIPEEYVEDPEEYYNEYFNNKYDLIFFHGMMDFVGCAAHLSENGKNSKTAPTFNSNKISKLATGPICGGHIHTGDTYKNKIFYTSSFSRFNFGEPEMKGFIMYTYDTVTKEYEVKRIENTLAPDYVTVKLADLEGDLEEKLEQIKTLREGYENVRIDISEQDKKGNENLVEAIKNLTDENVKLKVANSFEESYDARFDFVLKRTYPLDETIKRFISITKGKDLSSDIIKKIITKEE